MKIKRYIRKIAYVLVLCFVVLELSSVAMVFAAERKTREKERQWMQDAGAGLVDWRDQYAPLKEEDVPKAVGYEEAVWKNHIKRMYDEEGEQLHRVVFKNADGSRTQYLFDYPVKYVDEKGRVQDSSFEIADSKDGRFKYETAASMSKTRFPKDIKDGIKLSGEDVSVTLVPHDARDKEPERIDEETIFYEYDDNTTIEYSLTYTGFKEDIVVHEYTGQTEYEFTIYTEGLALAEMDGSYFLIDENEKIKATIGDIIIFTADEKNNTFGKLRAETVVDHEEYRMTIVLDPEYLADPETVYPIRIDPTVEITYDNNGSGAIEDVTINSARGSNGSSGSLSVGLRSTYGISRILMKFPGLDLSSLGSSAQITKAEVQLRDLMCEGTSLQVNCYVFTGNTWSESTANWSNVSPNSFSTFLSYQTMTYATGKTLSTKHRYSFDITAAVNGWLAGTCNQNKGIIFKATSTLENGSTYDCRTIASYNRASNKPSLSITYTTLGYNVLSEDKYYMNNTSTGRYVRNLSSSPAGNSGTLSGLGTSIQWQFKKVGGGYVIYSILNPTKYLAVSEDTSSEKVVFETIADAVPTRCIWRVIGASGGGYWFINLYNGKYLYSDSTNSLCVKTGLVHPSNETYNCYSWRVISTSKYGNTTSHTQRELSSAYSISPITFDIGDTAVPTINKSPTNAIWSNLSDFIFTVASETYIDWDEDTYTFTGKKSGTTTITVRHKVTNISKKFTVKVNKNAIIILPGVLGSVLVAGENNSNYEPGTVLWDTSIAQLSTEELKECLSEIRCGIYGESLNDVVVLQNKYGAGNVYKDLYNSLRASYDTQYEICFFAYDWRMSNAISAETLDDFISENSYDKVVLVAHSMGGLVASSYLSLGESQREKVEMLITLGSPLLGAPVATYIWGAQDLNETGLLDMLGTMDEETEEILNLLKKIDAIPFVLGDITSIYEVFPNKMYFSDEYAGKNYLYTPDSNTAVSDYISTRNNLIRYLPYYSSAFALDAEAFHDSLYVNSKHVTELVDSYYIAGYGIKTVENVLCENSDTWSVVGEKFNGDSLVPEWSATLGDRCPEQTFFAKNINHMTLLDNVEVLKFVNNLIEGNTSTTEFEIIKPDIQ